MSNDPTKSYVLCIDDGGYPESLEVRKVYAVLTDDRAAANHCIRVIDETGEDYLYPAKYFQSTKGATFNSPAHRAGKDANQTFQP
ncbi:MAG: hypothetical protein M3R15_06895 [Acidobacteriota bacterium]|nr:hypothetical protein [Acidobacteriota bacterium]